MNRSQGADGIRKLIDATKEKQWGISEVNLVSELVKGGVSIDTAINDRVKYQTITPTLVLKAEEVKKAGVVINTNYIRNVLRGKEKLNTNLFY
jgi:hypothetical protein